jgi:hypothetical protein
VFEFLAAGDNHWTLGGRRLELLEIAAGGDGAVHRGRLEIRGPLGIRRTVRTVVDAAEPPVLLSGRAQVGARTRAEVRWELAPDGGEGSQVRLRARVLSAGPLDRLLLAAGGRWWMRRAFAATLRSLAERLEAQGPHARAAAATLAPD